MQRYDEQTRAALRDGLMQGGASRGDADLVLDLAIHAAEEAERVLVNVVGRAPRFEMQVSALVIALQLGQHAFASLAERSIAQARDQGASYGVHAVSANL